MTAWASEAEVQERFHEATVDRRPADRGDVRFEVGTAEDCMEETPYWLEVVDDTGSVVEKHFFASAVERGDMIAAWRYAQTVPFEEEFAPFGPAWQREQAERGGVFV